MNIAWWHRFSAPTGLKALDGGRLNSMAEFEVAFVVDGREIRQDLRHAAGVRFEDVPPVRRFPSYAGQRNYPGLYYAAKMDRHVGFESWLDATRPWPWTSITAS